MIPASPNAVEGRVTIIVPTLREPSLGQSLDRLIEYLQTLTAFDFEIIVVDDSDPVEQARLEKETLERSEALSPRIALGFLAGPRRGKGAAVRMGARHASGAIVFTLDADLTIPLHHIAELIETIRATGADIVVAERPANRHPDNPVRDVLSRGMRLIQTALVFHAHCFEDTQCGFKAFRAKALQDLIERQIVDGGMYDLEYLYMAKRRGMRVERVPVGTLPEVRPSRLVLWRCLLQDPVDIARLKIAGQLGRYGR